MRDPNTIRFLTSNYPLLQGLRLIPVGIVTLVLTAWANTDRTASQDGAFLLWCYLIAIGGYFLTGRYYQHTYGAVRATRRRLALYLGIVAIASGLAMLTFWLDERYEGPVSFFGLFFAFGLMADYLCLTWPVRGRYLWIHPVFAGVVLVLSLLPLLGASGWWTLLGMHNAALAILLLISLFMLIDGWYTHRLLTRLLGPAILPASENGMRKLS